MSKTVSIYIDEKVWREFKMRCLEKGETMTRRISEMIQEWLSTQVKE